LHRKCISVNSIFDPSKSFQKKDDEELFLIFAGKRFYDDDDSLLAGIALRKRNFDSDKINAVRVERLKSIKEQVVEIENAQFINSRQFENMIYNVLGIIPLIYFVVYKSTDYDIESGLVIIGLSGAVVLGLIPALFARQRFGKSKERKLVKLQKKIELLMSI